eukprot:6056585-Pyramimonas_sp.AAC.1
MPLSVPFRDPQPSAAPSQVAASAFQGWGQYPKTSTFAPSPNQLYPVPTRKAPLPLPLRDPRSQAARGLPAARAFQGWGQYHSHCVS